MSIDLEPFIPQTVLTLKKGYSKALFCQDLLAGINVGIIALPLAMAFAIASGLSPAQGLYTAVVAGFLNSLFSGSPVQVGGPTGAFVVLILAIVQQQGYEGLAIATMMASFLLLALGLLRLGFIIRYVPSCVISGFTAGIAALIFTSQMKDLWQLPIAALPSSFIEKWQLYAQEVGAINPYAFLISTLSLILILFLRQKAPQVPAYLCVILFSALAALNFHLPLETVGSKFGAVPSSLPYPSLPSFTWERCFSLFPQALSIALLSAIESLLCAVAADRLSGTEHKADCELVAQGIANMGSVLFSGIPATGAIARTSANIRMGAKTPVAGMTHALFLLLIMALFAPYAAMIPLSSLAAILTVIAWQMAEIPHFWHLLKKRSDESACLLTTFGLTIFVDLTVAVICGTALFLLLSKSRSIYSEATK